VKERDIFDAALAIEDPAQRAAYVEQACQGNPALQEHIAALLEVDQQVGSFLGAPVASSIDTIEEPVCERPGAVIGPYQLLEPIGEGGFGVVFLAEQQEPIRRQVALKVLKPAQDTRQVVARFEAERQALALMDHPNIAHILDGGATASGRPYLVMELVRGIPLTDFCDQKHLSVRRRLELFVSVCGAVQHAHQKGIIHRDLKPSNVLVTLRDDKPVVKVIDFGIAKAIGQSLTDKTVQTGLVQLIGTPLYMSPEQAGLCGLDIDTRSDIYSLGVLLYELLIGTTPFDQERLRTVGFEEIRRIIREEEPARPSTRISTLGQAATTVSANRQSDPKQLSRLLRGELDWIVMKSLEKDRNRRYETANSLARDLQRYLADEPVQACPPSAGYRLRKFVRRHKAALTITACLLLVFTLLVGGLGWVFGDRASRRQGAAKAVSKALDEVRQLQAQGRWREAHATIRGAEGLLDSAGGSDELWQRCRQARADVDMLKSLEHARLQKPVGGDGFDRQASELLYAAAFQDYGLPVLCLDPREEAERIAASAIAPDLVAALLDWSDLTQNGTDEDRFLTVARLAERDPRRQEILAAAARRDRSILEKLAREVDVARHPPAFLLLLANGLPRQGGPARLALLRRVRQVYPGDFWVNNTLAQAFDEQEPPEREEALRYRTAAATLRPECPGARYNLGNALARQGKVDEAISEYQEALRLKPDYPMAHNNLGAALADKGQPDQAIASFKEAVRLKPDLVEALCNLGAALADKGQPDQAIASFKEAVRLKPDDAEAHVGLGVALAEQGRLDQAIEECREALRKNPGSATAYLNLGTFQAKQGQPDQAIASYKKAVQLKPELAEAHYNLGTALEKQGKLDEAIAPYKEAVRLKPNDAEAHVGLGNALLLGKGKVDEAIDEYQEALRLKPDFAQAHSNLGTALEKQGKLDKAIEEYQKAVTAWEQMVAKSPKAPNHNALGAELNDLALILRDRGQPVEARQLLERAVRHQKAALEITPQDPKYQQHLRNHYWSLAETLVRLKEHGAAAKAAAELPAVFSDSWQEYYLAAGFLARCVPLAEKDAQLPEPHRQALAQSYADRAMDLLRQAIRKGFKNAKKMKEDPDLDPLRPRADFQKLLAELEEKK
jgi:tetratricopeptide (TPR) repeat protein/serine/threonine protein kinase